jgi:glycosyltransferase involved in cell wall biosynthesis
MKLLSIVIPSYKDPLLHKTIDSLLENAEGDVEVIVALDGYWPATPIKNDPRIKIVHLGKNRGMRGAINAGVFVAKGEYLMRMDEHQMVGKGYDRILQETCQDNWIVTPRRYALNPVKWEIMQEVPAIDYMKLKIVGLRDDAGNRLEKFSGVEWDRPDRKDIMIDETMAMQGSCWFMPHSWWDKVIVELQSDGYGTHYQDSHEMVFKTWKAGGKLMVNKNTWHAHKHRTFPRTHGYGGQPARDGFKYALDVWRDYYEQEIRPNWRGK